MHSEPFDFTGAQGQRLAGRLDLPEGPVRSHALFAHCFTCTKSSLAAVRIARALTARGFGVLRFDFTGLGQSEGSFADSSFSGSVDDLLAAAQALAARGAAPGLLIGHSLGGATTLAAASRLPDVKAVATIGTPFDVAHVTHLFGGGLQALEQHGEAEVDIGGRPFRLRRAFVDDLSMHDQGARIATLRRALLVLHAPGDRTVDISNAAAIFQAARHPKSFVSLDDADHLLTGSADADYAAEVIAAWASRYLAHTTALRNAADPGEVVVESTGAGVFQMEVLAGAARFIADEPVEVGGLGSGATPYDLVSAGLGACTAMTLRTFAQRKGWPLDRVRVMVGHARSAEASPRDEFRREIVIEGALSAEQRARLVEIAGRCPVHRTLAHGARVRTRAVDTLVPLDGIETAEQHAHDMEHDAADEAG
jgi:putative redox protein